MKHINKLMAVIAICLSLAVFGCKKKSEPPPQAANLLEHQVLSYMPANTYGFLMFESESDAFKRFRASTASGSQMLDGLKQAASLNAKQDFATVLNALMQTRAFNPEPGKPLAFRGGAAFLSVDPESRGVEGSFCLLAAPGADLQQDLNTFRSALGASAPIEEQQYGTAKGFAFKVDAASPQRIHAAVDQTRLVIGSSPQIVSAILSQKAPEGIQQMRTSPAYTRATAALPPAANQIAYGFFDIEVLASLARKGKLGMPAESANEDLKDLPVEGIAFARSMGENLTDSGVVTLKAKNDEQKKAFAALNAGGAGLTWSSMPAGVLIFLGFDGRAVAQIRDAALEKAPPEQAAAMKASLAALDSISSVGLGIRPGQGPMPFPEIILAAKAKEAAKLGQTLLTQLSELTTTAGLPVSPWAEKEIAGVKANFTQSPFGMGAFLVALEDQVILSTSEQAAADTIQAVKGSAPAITKSMAKAAQNLAAQPKSLFGFYGNFSQLSDTLGNVQGSLSMFTGGQPPFNAEQLQNLRQMGSVMINASMDNDILRINTAYEPAPAVKSK